MLHSIEGLGKNLIEKYSKFGLIKPKLKGYHGMSKTPEIILEVLAKSTLFHGLTSEQLENLAPFAKVHDHLPGDIIIREGDHSSDLFIVANGLVEVIKEGEDTRETHSIAKLKEGDYFGEMAVFEESTRAATVRAVESSQVISLPASILMQPGNGRNSIYGVTLTNITTQLSSRLRNTNKLAVAALQRELILVRKMAEKSLRESREQLKVITDTLPVLIAYIDTEECYRFINKVYEEWFDRPRGEILNRPVKEILGEVAYRAFNKFFHQALFGREVNYEIVIPYKKTQERYVNAVLVPHVVDGEIKGLFSLMNDVTPHKRAQERLNYLASHDPLTKLPNRSLFYEKLNNALAYASHNKKIFAILFLDLDRFKYINDNLGHDIGDLLLNSVVGRLKSCVRATDTIARLGGDEFTIILEDLDSVASVHHIAEKICLKLAEPYSIGENDIAITVSIGISTYPQDGTDANTLLKNADMAMYTAKAKGRNNYQFVTAQLTEENVGKLNLENHLANALDHEEFFIEYTPEINLKTKLVAAIRPVLLWDNSELGKLGGEDFFVTAERMNLLQHIHRWVIKTACNQFRIWQENKFIASGVTLIIHIPSASLIEEDYQEFLVNMITSADLQLENIRIEITETTIMAAQSHSVNALINLQRMGISVCISEFGAGYSSLNFIKSIDLSCVKIDRSYTDNLLEDKDNATLVKAIVALCHTMGIKVVVENVTTEEALKYLASIECDQIEGPLVSPPLNTIKMGAYLKQFSKM